LRRVRAVQNARKALGWRFSDRIVLTLGGDAEILDAAREHEALIAGEVLATSVGYEDGRHARPASEAKVDGRPLTIAVVARAAS